MKRVSLILLSAISAIAFAPTFDARAVVATTNGNNLTAFNPSGANNNNNWNSLINSRNSVGTPATADFGNCNALILRCAQPKCANGGCTSMDVAASIVSGCVQSNDSCKQYGNDLVQYISAQLVASSTAKANESAAQAAAAAQNAAAQQSAQQMQQMQMQMQQMQAEMAAQNAQAIAQLQSALDEQKQLTADAMAQNSANAGATGTNAEMVASPSGENQLTAAQVAAAQNGVSSDILLREQISGEILSKIENAEVAMKSLKATMETAFEYAGCDKKGNNCAGPKRVKVFKDRAEQFFEPYNDVLDEMYDALITAQSVGVDITDIYMMLEGSCNIWGQYLCAYPENGNKRYTYNNSNCINGRSVAGDGAKGGHSCTMGMVIPAEDDMYCTLNKTLSSSDQVYRDWLDSEKNGDDSIRVGCASAALDNSKIFGKRKKQASIDVEILERIIEQDAPAIYGSGLFGGNTTPANDGVIYCAVNENTLSELQKAVNLKQLPEKVCVKDLKSTYSKKIGTGPVTSDTTIETSSYCSTSIAAGTAECKCKNSGGIWTLNSTCSCPFGYSEDLNGECKFNMTDGTKSLGPVEKAAKNLFKMPDLNANSQAIKDCVAAGKNWDVGTHTCK